MQEVKIYSVDFDTIYFYAQKRGVFFADALHELLQLAEDKTRQEQADHEHN